MGGPDPDQLQADIDRAVGAYVASLTAIEVSGGADGVEARMRLSGELTDVIFDPAVLTRYGPAGLGELVVEAVADAARTAGDRREHLARAVAVHDQPVLDLVQDMIDDPAGAVERLRVGG